MAASFFSNLRNTLIVSFIIALIIVAGYHFHDGGAHEVFWQAVFRWLHVLFGVMWIGLLWYFNFVQIRKMPEIPAELKPGVSKYIAPEALFWFRWAALFTVLAGLGIIGLRGTQGPPYPAEVVPLGFAGGYAGADKNHTPPGLGTYPAP